MGYFTASKMHTYPVKDPTMPNKDGYFGEYGGAFLPPPLVPIMEEITAKYEELKADPHLLGRAPRAREAVHRPPFPHLPRQAPLREGGRRADLPQARGPQPHRRAQDQPLPGRGAPAPSAWAEEAHRRDGRGPARRRARHRRRPRRPRVRHLHGRGRHGEGTPQRRAHENPRCEGRPATDGLKTLKEAVDAAFGAYMQDPVTQFYAIGSVVGPIRSR